MGASGRAPIGGIIEMAEWDLDRGRRGVTAGWGCGTLLDPWGALPNPERVWVFIYLCFNLLFADGCVFIFYARCPRPLTIGSWSDEPHKE